MHSSVQRLRDNISSVVVGKHRAIELVLVALIARGHILIEDVPGVGKTSLIRALAQSTGLSFKRLQFTPDLMPADVTGVSIWDAEAKQFRFEPGPVFTNIVLADEINRTSPRTQSSLLEAMEERQVSVDGVTRVLPDPFFVLATQNPIEYEGTFPLPESQLDRFLMRIDLGYPTMAEESLIIDRHGSVLRRPDLPAVCTKQDILEVQEEASAVVCGPAVRDYIVRICQATRSRVNVYLGASPRASLALFRAARAFAYVRGRDYILPDDVKHVAKPVLAHRILLTQEARVSGATPLAIVEQLLASIPAPV